MRKKSFTQSMSSTVPAIENLRFHSIPKDKALDVEKMAAHGGVTIYLGRDGRMHGAGITFGGHYGMGRGRADDYLRCAEKLGLITAADLKKHFKDCDAHEEARRKSRAATEFLRYAETCGIELTKAQMKKLKAMEG